MDPTTLFTFLFRTPPDVRVVELLGSWDNFRRPYRMYHDRRRGQGVWTGCFKFQDIVFDGQLTQWTKPRTGCLKQGGIYWYYYRLNDDVEVCDDRQEQTIDCPLLPGQMVNVLDIPWEEVEIPSSRKSVSLDATTTFLARQASTHTLDPNDKYAALDPPPISRVHGRCVSDLALNGRLESTTEPLIRTPVSPSTPPSERSACKSKTRMFSPRSRFYVSKAIISNVSKSILSRRSSHTSVAGPTQFSVTSGTHNDVHEGDSAPLHPVMSSYRAPISQPASPGEDYPNKSARMKDGSADHTQTSSATNIICNRRVHDPEDDITALPPMSEFERPTTSYGCAPRPFSASSQSNDCWPFASHHHAQKEQIVLDDVHYDDDDDDDNDDDTRSSFSHRQHSPSVDPSPSNQGTQLPFEVDSLEEISSPTFSVATVSSNSDINTPFRLSFTHSRSATSDTAVIIDDKDNNDNNDQEANQRVYSSRPRPIPERPLQSQSSSSLPDNTYTLQGHNTNLSDRFLPPTTFAGYSLPLVAEESVQSLGKLSSTTAHHIDADSNSSDPDGSTYPHRSGSPRLSISFVSSTSGTGGDNCTTTQLNRSLSFPDVIFNELAYLSGSIT